MFDYYFTFRSITFAQEAQRVLAKEHVKGLLLRAPKRMSAKGCGYALKLRPDDGQRAAAAFRKWSVPYSAVYRVAPDGSAEGIRL